MKKARTEKFEPEVCVAVGVEHRGLKDNFSGSVYKMKECTDLWIVLG